MEPGEHTVQYVTRQELSNTLSSVEERIDKRLDVLGTSIADLGKKLDHRGLLARNTWLQFGAILLGSLSMAGALVAFALNGAVAPLHSTNQAQVELNARMNARMGDLDDKEDSTREDLEYARGRQSIFETLLMQDLSLRSESDDGGVNEARLEQLMGRSTELWQLLETVKLQINNIDKRLAVIENDN